MNIGQNTSTMKDIWLMIKDGEFEQACRQADIEFGLTGNHFQLHNKLKALMHLKKYEEVISLCKKLTLLKKESNPHLDLSSSNEFIYSGIANWLLNKKSKAIKLWLEGQHCVFQDAAGGVIIRLYQYFAAIKTNDEYLKNKAIHGIATLLRKKTSSNWPGPIGFYICGIITESQLLSYISTIPILRERNLCQANFAIAIKKLEVGHIDAYYDKLSDCIKDGPLAYIESEYYMASGELELLKNADPI